jgi:hypothetical protein
MQGHQPGPVGRPAIHRQEGGLTAPGTSQRLCDVHGEAAANQQFRRRIRIQRLASV